MSVWNIKEQDQESVFAISARFGISAVAAKLFINRGFSFFDVEDILSKCPTPTNDPFLLPDMDKAVERIRLAIERGERITVYGDYDVDGITSVVSVYKYLTSVGGIADYYIPDRTGEGYGLNEGAISSIGANGTTLIITVDTGITAVKEVAFAKSLGIDLIVTDHHECKDEIPDCVAVINPKRKDSKYPFPELAGVGVAFKLICALMGDEKEAFRLYGEFLAVGTVADIMPVLGENRTILLNGLSALSLQPTWLKALFGEMGSNLSGRKINTSTVAFQIAPRLNAAGRVGDPYDSVKLLLSDDYATASEYARLVCAANSQRQKIEQQIFDDIEERFDPASDKRKILIYGSENWYNGVIGIVASKLSEKYLKPCVLVCFDGDLAKGSARSVKGFNIFEAFDSVSEHLVKFGGHELAAGLTVKREDFETFSAALSEYADKNIPDGGYEQSIEVECSLYPSELSLSTVREQLLLEPYGNSNPVPLFAVFGVKVEDIIPVGSGKHLKILFSLEGKEYQAMAFGKKPEDAFFAPGDTIDFLCNLDENVFNGQSSLLISIRHMRFSAQEDEDRATVGISEYNTLLSGDTSSELISYEDVSSVYSFLTRQNNAGNSVFNVSGMARAVSFADGKADVCRLLLCLKVLSELDLAEAKMSESTVTATASAGGQKRILNNSATWCRFSIKK